MKKVLSKKKDFAEQRAVNPTLQIILMIVTTAVLGFLLSFPLRDFNPFDQVPELKSLTPQKMLEFGGVPKFVDVGLYVRDFPEFDFRQGKFKIDGILWFEFDPSYISLDMLGKFTFERGTVKHISSPYTRIIGNRLFARYDVVVEFTLPLFYRMFPLDDHRLSLVLTHPFVSPGEIVFRSSQQRLVVQPDTRKVGWSMVDHSVRTGYTEASLEKHDTRKKVYRPRVIFVLDFKRAGVRHIISIFLPLLLMFFVSLFSFSFDPIAYKGSVVSLSAGGVSAMIAFRFVIESMSPVVGYLMMSDFIFFTFLFVNFVVFFVNIFAANISAGLKTFLVFFLHGIVVASSAYLFIFWL